MTQQLEAEEGFERRARSACSARSTCAIAARSTSSPSPFVGDDVSAEIARADGRAASSSSTRRSTARQSAYREAGIELVSFRLRGVGVVRKPELARRGARRRGRRRMRSSSASRPGWTRRCARGGSRLRLRAAPSREPPFAGPGDRLDADHDARRRARPGGAAGRAPKPRRLGWRLRSTQGVARHVDSGRGLAPFYRPCYRTERIAGDAVAPRVAPGAASAPADVVLPGQSRALVVRDAPDARTLSG